MNKLERLREAINELADELPSVRDNRDLMACDDDDDVDSKVRAAEDKVAGAIARFWRATQ